MSANESVEEFLMNAIAVATNLDRSWLTPSMVLTEAGIDSLNLTAVIARVEAEYGCGFDEAELIQMFGAERVSDVIALVQRAIAS